MEALAREQRYSASAAPSPVKKPKLSKRAKKKQRSGESALERMQLDPTCPPSSQKRLKLEPHTYRALLEAASPRRRPSSGTQPQQQQQQQHGQQPIRRPVTFRRINPNATLPPLFSLPPPPLSEPAAPSQPRPVFSPVTSFSNRHKTPLFLPEDDDELADEIIARGAAREAARRLAAERAAFGSPSTRRVLVSTSSGEDSVSESEADASVSRASSLLRDAGRTADPHAFSDHIRESPAPANAVAGPSRLPATAARQDSDDDEDFTVLPGFEGMAQRGPFGSSESPPSDRSPDLPPAHTAAPAAAVQATAGAKGKGKKRAAAADDDGGAPAAKKITRKRESYQLKATTMWMREQCLTLDEANARWARYLALQGGSKGGTFKAVMQQRDNVLVARWMKDDGLAFELAETRLRALHEREAREKRQAANLANKEKAAAAATAPSTGDRAEDVSDGDAPHLAAFLATAHTPAVSAPSPKRARAPRTKKAAAATSAADSRGSAAGSLAVKPSRSPAKPRTTSAAHSAGAGARRKGPVSNTARAVELLCETEGGRSPEARLTIIDLFSAQDNSAEVYLSLPDPALRAAWVERRLREKGGGF